MERKDRHENGLARKTVLAIETHQNNKLKKFTQTSRNSPKEQVAGKHLEVYPNILKSPKTSTSCSGQHLAQNKDSWLPRRRTQYFKGWQTWPQNVFVFVFQEMTDLASKCFCLCLSKDDRPGLAVDPLPSRYSSPSDESEESPVKGIERIWLARCKNN